MGARCHKEGRANGDDGPAKKLDPPAIPELLSAKEKAIVKHDWAEFGEEKQLDIIERVWRTAAARSPRVCAILGLHEPHAEHKPPRFALLTEAVQRFFDTLITQHKLDDEKLLQASFDLGVSHAAFSDDTFQPIYWDIFVVSFGDVFHKVDLPKVKADKKYKHIYIWNKLCFLLISQMLDAYRAARKQIHVQERKGKTSAEEIVLNIA